MEQAIKALPDGSDILSANCDWNPQYNQILLSDIGIVPETENAETTVESSGAVAKIAVICGIRVKWYPKEGNE